MLDETFQSEDLNYSSGQGFFFFFYYFPTSFPIPPFLPHSSHLFYFSIIFYILDFLLYILRHLLNSIFEHEYYLNSILSNLSIYFFQYSASIYGKQIILNGYILPLNISENLILKKFSHTFHCLFLLESRRQIVLGK